MDEIRALLPEKYSKWAHLFNPKEANVLPPRRERVDHEINLIDNGFPKRKMYGLTRKETRAVKVYIDKIMGKGFIRPSTSLLAALLLVA